MIETPRQVACWKRIGLQLKGIKMRLFTAGGVQRERTLVSRTQINVSPTLIGHFVGDFADRWVVSDRRCGRPTLLFGERYRSDLFQR